MHFLYPKKACIVYDGLLGLVRWSSQVAHRVSFSLNCVLRVYGNMIIFSIFIVRSVVWPVGKKKPETMGLFFLQMVEWGIKTI